MTVHGDKQKAKLCSLHCGALLRLKADLGFPLRHEARKRRFVRLLPRHQPRALKGPERTADTGTLQPGPAKGLQQNQGAGNAAVLQTGDEGPFQVEALIVSERAAIAASS